jgi:hypothetical protein
MDAAEDIQKEMPPIWAKRNAAHMGKKKCCAYGQHFFVDILCCIHVFYPQKAFFYVVHHLDSITSYLPTGRHLGLFRLWRSLYLPSSFPSVFLVLTFVSASNSMLFWVIFLLPLSEHGRTMSAGSVQFLL